MKSGKPKPLLAEAATTNFLPVKEAALVVVLVSSAPDESALRALISFLILTPSCVLIIFVHLDNVSIPLLHSPRNRSVFGVICDLY